MHDICRICLEETECGASLLRSNYGPKMAMFAPEMDLYIVKDPKLCNNCVTSLDVAYNFRMKCINTDKIIERYLNYSPIFNVKGAEKVKIEPIVDLFKLKSFMRQKAYKGTEGIIVLNELSCKNDNTIQVNEKPGLKTNLKVCGEQKDENTFKPTQVVHPKRSQEIIIKNRILNSFIEPSNNVRSTCTKTLGNHSKLYYEDSANIALVPPTRTYQNYHKRAKVIIERPNVTNTNKAENVTYIDSNGKNYVQTNNVPFNTYARTHVHNKSKINEVKSNLENNNDQASTKVINSKQTVIIKKIRLSLDHKNNNTSATKPVMQNSITNDEKNLPAVKQESIIKIELDDEVPIIDVDALEIKTENEPDINSDEISSKCPAKVDSVVIEPEAIYFPVEQQIGDKSYNINELYYKEGNPSEVKCKIEVED